MRLLIDTQILIWTGQGSPRLSRRITDLLNDPQTTLLFSAISIAEVAIKWAQNRPDFRVEPAEFRQLLLGNGYVELPLLGEHAQRVGSLRTVHKDPFDRLLVAQALVEGIGFVTADTTLKDYPGQIILV